MKTAIIIICCVLALLLVLTILYVLSLRTGRRRAVAAPFAKAVYAHRGYHNEEKGVPENSLTAFSLAVADGYGIELDVHLSKDDVPVVFHDPTLTRMCGVDARICDFTVEELKKFTLSGVSGEKIPTLEEVLSLVGGRVPLCVEIKSEYRPITTCETAQKLLDNYGGAYCVECFDPRVVRWYKKNRPQVVRGLLSDIFRNYRGIKFRLLSAMAFNFICTPDFISYNFERRKSLPFRIVRKIYHPYTFAWTPRNDEEAAGCYDFDTLIFENLRL